MATVVDELVITLGLDTTNFRRDVQQVEADTKRVSEQARKNSDAIESAGKRAGETVTQLTNGFRTFLGIFAGGAAAAGFEQFLKSVSSSDAAIGRLSTQMHVAPRYLDALGEAAKEAGGNFQSAVSSLAGMNDELAKARRGERPAWWGAFTQMGGTQAGLKDLPTFLDQVAQGYARLAKIDPTQAASLLRQIIPDEGLRNAIVQFGPAFRQHIQDIESYGGATPKATKAAQDMQAAMSRFEYAIKDVGRAINTELAPYVTDISNKMADWLKANKAWLDQKIHEVIQMAADAAKNFWTYLQQIDWQKIGTDIKGFVDGFIAFAKSIDWKRIGQDIKDVFTAVNTFLDSMRKAKTALDPAAEAFGGWGKAITDLLEIWTGVKMALFITRLTGLPALLNTLLASLNPVTAAVVAAAAAVGGIYLAGKEENALVEEAKQKLGDKYEYVPDDIMGGPGMYRNKQTGEMVESDVVARELGHTHGYVTPGELLSGQTPAASQSPSPPASPQSTPPAPPQAPAPAATPSDYKWWNPFTWGGGGAPASPAAAASPVVLGQADTPYQTAGLSWVTGSSSGPAVPGVAAPDESQVRSNASAIIAGMRGAAGMSTDPTQPTGGGGRGGGGPALNRAPPANRDQRAAMMRDYFAKNLGISSLAASRLVSAMIHESTLDPTIGYGGLHGQAALIGLPGHGDFGIAQWVGSRKQSLIRFAKENNLDVFALDTQMRFVVKEMQTTHRYALNELRAGNPLAGHAYEAGSDYSMPSTQRFHLEQVGHVAALPPSDLNTASMAPPGNGGGGGGNSSSVTIGQIHVHTQATDADGIAKDIHKSLKRYDYVHNMNYGLS